MGDQLAADFYTEIAAFLDAGTRKLIVDSLDDAGHANFVVARVTQAIEDDPRVAGRLALWGRRLMGEALSQAQRVAVERDSLAALLAGGVDRPGLDLAALTRMFTRLTEGMRNAWKPSAWRAERRREGGYFLAPRPVMPAATTTSTAATMTCTMWRNQSMPRVLSDPPSAV
ncbi:MAG: ferritin-like fold-containing protein [Marmoricola sp.]